MSKTLFTNLEAVGVVSNLIDNIAYRNIRIMTYYEALQDINPDLKYSHKIKILSVKFGLAEKSIDGIICKFTKSNPQNK